MVYYFWLVLASMDIDVLELQPQLWSDQSVNSLSPGDEYIHQWTGSLPVLIMACHFLVPSHYLNQWWCLVSWYHANKLQWNFYQNVMISSQEDEMHVFENVVCYLSAILSWGWRGAHKYVVTIIATLRWASCGPGTACAWTTRRPAQGCDYCN